MDCENIRVEGDLAFVQLTRGYEAIIDAIDINAVSGYAWTSIVERRKDGSIRNVYAKRGESIKGGGRKTIYMHRVIAKTPSGMDTDHIDGNGLNNTRSNLRVATKAQNQHNQRTREGSLSGVKGVSLHKQTGLWRANIAVNGTRKYLGYFKDVKDAINAYESASLEFHGEFKRI